MYFFAVLVHDTLLKRRPTVFITITFLGSFPFNACLIRE
jgi:hypothetical protein